VLQYEKICPEYTTFGGSPLPTRYFANDCLVSVQHNASRNALHDINLVVMTPAAGGVGDSMTQSEPYIAMALQHIEDSSLLPGYRINAYLADSLCSPPDATANIMRAMLTGPTKHGIVGDGCSGGCMAVNDAMQYFNVLQIAHACVSTGLSDHNRHPFYTRLSPTASLSVDTAIQVMKAFLWHRVGVIHGFRSLSVSGKDTFLAKVQEDMDAGTYEWIILMVLQVSDEADAISATEERQRKDSRVTAMIVYEDVGAKLLCAAYHQSLFAPYWVEVLMVTGWTDVFLQNLGVAADSANPPMSCTKEQMFQAGYGLLSTTSMAGFIESRGNDRHGISNVPINDVHDSYWQECVKFFGSNLGCNDVVPPYMYDAVLHFALILHRYLIEEQHNYTDLNTASSRESLFNLSLAADYVGLTGRVRQYNLRDPVSSDFDGSLGDREGPSLIRQLTGSPTFVWTALGHRMPADKTLVWLDDIRWSEDDPSQFIPCKDATECDLANGVLPPDARPEDCPANTIYSRDMGCERCPAGFYTNGSSCIPCGGGNASSIEGQAECTPCAVGKFSKLLGSTGCSDCDVGHFANTTGASACQRCELGRYENETGSSSCKACGGRLVTRFPSATSEQDCVCPQNTYRPQDQAWGVCYDCTEGLDCSIGTGMNGGMETLPVVEEGYYADASLSVFKCFDDGKRCLRGTLGLQCASGRRGRVCGDCEDGKAPHNDGTCKKCDEDGGDSAVVVIVILIGACAAVMIYLVFDRTDVTRQNYKALLIAMIMSLVMTTLQQVGALAVVSIAWPGPMRDLFRIVMLLAFDLEILKLNCVVPLRPLLAFAMQLFTFLGCIVIMCITHLMWVTLRHARQFRSHNPNLVSGLGTIFLIFYVTVFIATLTPVQCAKNPNGLWTLKSYPSVICWNGGEEHHAMLVLGAIALFIPLGFLACCCWVIWVLPEKLKAGKAFFLRAFAFLFFRYKPHAYWFSVVHLMRSLLIALTTIMPVAGVQILLMQFVVILQLTLVCLLRPWRVEGANALEAVLTLGLLLMLSCALLLTGAAGESTELAWTFVVFLALCLSVALGFAVNAACALVLAKFRKPFDIFLCHHKAAAGCMARYINVEFSARNRHAFIDTDNLRDLGKLFDYVATQTQVLCVLCTKMILTRPWCAGEIATAVSSGVHIVKVLRSDYHEPEEVFIEDYEAQVGGDLQCLMEVGISVPHIQQALRKLITMHGINLPHVLSPPTMHSLCNTLLSREHHHHRDVAHVPQPKNPEASVIIIADISNLEAACSGILLVDMLIMHMQDLSHTPLLLTHEAEYPLKPDFFLLLCSAGCMSKELVLNFLGETCQRDVSGLPVVVDENFHFPSHDDITRNLAFHRQQSGDAEDTDVDEADRGDLHGFIVAIFKIIASMFQPSNYGSTREVLDAKARDIAARIKKHEGKGSGNTAILASTPTLKALNSQQPHSSAAGTSSFGSRGVENTYSAKWSTFGEAPSLMQV